MHVSPITMTYKSLSRISSFADDTSYSIVFCLQEL